MEKNAILRRVWLNGSGILEPSFIYARNRQRACRLIEKFQLIFLSSLMLASVVFLIIALATYDSADNLASFPSWMTSVYQPDQLIYPGNTSIHNACGKLGAWIADFLFHSLGFGAYYLVVGLVTLQFRF
ncbi:MAG: DNA translocase FtsK 4TM domain-containing protein [Pirellulaceae bacterium]